MLKTWTALSLQQQILALVSTVGFIAAFWALVVVSGREGEALLFAGLEPSAAGEVTAELDGMGTTYSVRGSGIYVPESQRDRLRIELARQGLPASDGVGYELLDSLNGFSTTADMFDAAYWRAKEGELTRTIVSMPNVKSARVHLGVNRQSAFRRQRSDKSASVTVDAPSGLNEEQARSIQYLTALAISNLPPEAVAVIDTKRGLIAGPGAKGGSFAGLDVNSRTQELENRLTAMLEAHVGYGNARVSVAMDVQRTAFAQTERLVDPDSRQVATRSLVEERDVQDVTGGPVTVASNLPDGDAEVAAEEEQGPVKRLKRNEQVTYTGNEVERITEQAAGAIERLTVAVMLNDRTMVNEDGVPVAVPRSEEEMAAIEALIISAAGINTDRGDALTLRTLPFEPPVVIESVPPGFVEAYVMPQAVQIGQMVLLGLITLILGLFVVKPLLSPKPVPIAEAEIAEGTRALPTDAASLLTMLTEENPDDVAAILDDWFEDEQQQPA